MNKIEYQLALERLGHWNIAVVRRTRGGFYVLCECGYRSARRALEVEGVKTAMYHREQMLRKARTDGVSLLELTSDHGRQCESVSTLPAGR